MDCKPAHGQTWTEKLSVEFMLRVLLALTNHLTGTHCRGAMPMGREAEQARGSTAELLQEAGAKGVAQSALPH